MFGYSFSVYILLHSIRTSFGWIFQWNITFWLHSSLVSEQVNSPIRFVNDLWNLSIDYFGLTHSNTFAPDFSCSWYKLRPDSVQTSCWAGILPHFQDSPRLDSTLWAIALVLLSALLKVLTPWNRQDRHLHDPFEIIILLFNSTTEKRRIAYRSMFCALFWNARTHHKKKIQHTFKNEIYICNNERQAEN